MRTLVGVLASLLLVAIARYVPAADKLNVVLIAVDDMNCDVGCYGHPLVKTPAIDRLAARGVRFDRAYCQYPVCNPSRVSMLSGRRPDTAGVFDLVTPPRTYLRDAVFLPEYFRQQGYTTAHIGKIYHTGDPQEDPQSWDFETREWGKHPPQEAVIREQRIERPEKYYVEWNELRSSDEETADGAVARQSSELLDKLVKDTKPFLLGVGFRRPHSPYAAPKRYFDIYPVETIPPLVEPAAHLQGIPPVALTYPRDVPLLSAHERAETVAAYWACISFVDAQIGIVLDALDRNDLWKNTIVVFYSDHGYHLGEHGGLWHKMTLFEESARVPLVIAAPNIAGGGRVCNRVVELVDIYPTLVQLAPLPPMKGLEGASLCPLLDDPADGSHRWHKAASTQVVHGGVVGRSIRTERFRYIEWDGGSAGVELYDHDNDPREFVNLSGDPQFADVRSHLHKRVQPERDAKKVPPATPKPPPTTGSN
ncbi:MAG: sulfatase [Pirellulales bacterium]